MANAQILRAKVCSAIDNVAGELNELSKSLWENPELNFEEHFAHDTLTSFFEKHGFHVQKKYALDTAFVASNKASQEENVPCVAILCEYDALPEIGHACGHNLIAEAGAAAAVGVKSALEHAPEDLGHLVVMGTPAEEGGGGKILMLEEGCFDKVDFSMMVHPAPFDAIYSQSLAVQNVYVTFNGRASHAAAFPWEGVNALDAAVLSYNAISMLRQQIKPTWRAHGVFTNGGIEPAIIPEKAQLHYYFRAPSLKELEEFRTKAENCFRAAAEATGCSVEIKWCGHGKGNQPYIDLLINPVLGDLYQKHAESLGIQFPPQVIQAGFPSGSTDMGNVSHAVPCIHPFFSINTKAGNHTHQFTNATGSEAAQSPTLVAAKAMAMATVDVLCNPELLQQMKEKHKKHNYVK